MASQQPKTTPRPKHPNYNFRPTEVRVIAFLDDSPLQLIIVKSGTSGMYHVIEDEPGPCFAHNFYDEYQIKFLYGIDVNQWFFMTKRSEPFISPDYQQ